LPTRSGFRVSNAERAIMIGKIGILGGGSVYTPELVSSIIAHNVGIEEIALMGRSEHKLDVVAKFCQRMFDKNGFPTKVRGTTSVEETVTGAKYVLNQIRVGGMSARARDEARAADVALVADESLGAGGISNALRTVPVALEYARIIEEKSPRTILINLTNPMSMVVEAIAKQTKLNVVGVCDAPAQSVRRITQMLRADGVELHVDYIGVNHFGWIQDVKVNGRSQMSRLVDRVLRKKPDGFDLELIELFRMIPMRLASYFFHPTAVLKRQKEATKFRGDQLRENEQVILKEYENESLCDVPELTRGRNAMWYELCIVPLIEAFESKAPRELVLCLTNNSALKDLPDSASVEVPAKVSKKGISVRKIGQSPCFLRGLLCSLKTSEEIALRAIEENCYEFALQALTINPLVRSVSKARRFLDRVIQEEKLSLK